MEEDKKLEKRKNTEIVALSIIIVVLLGSLIYLLFINKDDKPVDNKGKKNNSVKLYNIYKTTDEKFTLKIVDNKKAYLIVSLSSEPYFSSLSSLISSWNRIILNKPLAFSDKVLSVRYFIFLLILK